MKNTSQRGFAILPLLFIVVAIAAAAGIGYAISTQTDLFQSKKADENTNTDAVACTEEAKLCPDGSYVGRTGPNCAFADCPTTNTNVAVNTNSSANTNTNTAIDETADWKTYTNTKYSYSFKYPKTWKLTEYTYSPSADNPFSEDWVTVVNPTDAGNSFSVCPDDRGGDCLPVQDGKYDMKDSTITVANRDAVEQTYTYAAGQASCSTCVPVKAINFKERPTGWQGSTDFSSDRDILLRSDLKASFSTTEQILSSFVLISPTANWKTYTSEALGFSLKIPTDWAGYKTKVTADSVSFTHPKTSAVDFSIQRSTAEEIVGAGKVGSGNGYNYFMSVSNGVIPSAYQSAWDEIVTIKTTVKIADQTAGWKTYENKQLGYTVKYPPTWKTSTCGNGVIWFGVQGVGCETDASTTDFLITKSNTAPDLVQEKRDILDPKETTVKVDGISSTRITGTTKKDSNAFYGGGVYQDHVFVHKGSAWYRIGYFVAPGQTNHVDEFALFLTTVIFN